MLMTIVRQYPFVHGWLTVKVVLLVVYILAALLVFGYIYSVARAHDPAWCFPLILGAAR
jgi:uncharacterized membrane protein SirB2